MKKIFYFAASILFITSASSCSKQCVQCTAKDKNGAIIFTSNVICDGPENRKHFEKRFESDFGSYTTACVNASN
jgi:hypothetical protein